MTKAETLAYCLAKPGAWQDEPWDGDVVAKVGSKIFVFLGADEAATDASVMAYIGRSGWNSLRIGGAIPDDEILEAVDASYDAVVAKLPKKERPA